jgi:hypothetical protein
MSTRSDELDMAAALLALRPSPRGGFTAELDARAAAGFPDARKTRPLAFRRVANRLRHVRPQRLAGLAGAAALLAIAVSTAMISTNNLQDNSGPHPIAETRHPGSHEFSVAPEVASGQRPSESLASGGSAATESAPAEGNPRAGFELSIAPPNSPAALPAPSSHRDVERGAELVLRSEPGKIEDDAKEVFAAVHAAHGIVLDSSIHDWKANAGSHAGEARAGFELLLPSARLGDTMATLSRIAPVRSRHESTSDITAPTVIIRDRLLTSEAKVEGLLTQLANAASGEERIATEAELRREHHRVDALRGQLDRLRRRADYAHVTVRLEGRSTAGSGSAGWGVDDALGDAGRVLTIAAGVVIVGLAVVGPLALIAFLVWLTNRARLRRSRERALV